MVRKILAGVPIKQVTMLEIEGPGMGAGSKMNLYPTRSWNFFELCLIDSLEDLSCRYKVARIELRGL